MADMSDMAGETMARVGETLRGAKPLDISEISRQETEALLRELMPAPLNSFPKHVGELTISTKGKESRTVAMTVLTEGLPYVIGRRMNLDIGLPVLIEDEKVSRLHCIITVEGDSYFLEDPGSSNGTFINGKSSLDKKRKYELKSGDFILLGPDTKISFVIQKREDPQ